MNIQESRIDFAKEILRWRTQQQLSVREFSQRAGLSASLISSLEQGERPISSQSALKLVDAFNLQGCQREQFLLKAAATKRRDRIVAYAR